MTELIIALDFSSENDVDKFLLNVDPAKCILKIGSELFTTLGPYLVKKLVNQGYRIFLDLKFHDIPNTVAHACKAAADLGVWMLNVHASGGLSMMQKAKDSLEEYGEKRPLLLAVTVLTSMNSADLKSVGVERSIKQQVEELAVLVKEAELDGIICSAQEASTLKTLCGSSFITVTPGIRLPGDASNDQSRIMTPSEASHIGVDYIVMGRPITQSPHPEMVIDTVLSFLLPKSI